MAASERFKACKYCGQKFDPEHFLSSGGMTHHLDACPMVGGLLEQPDRQKLAEWEEGYQYGFEDNYIHPYSLKLLPPSYCLGYLTGKGKIDRLVEQAVERNYGYEYDE